MAVEKLLKAADKTMKAQKAANKDSQSLVYINEIKQERIIKTVNLKKLMDSLEKTYAERLLGDKQ